MTSTGRVLSVDPVTDKDGAPAWQVITDYAERDADNLTRCAFWMPRPGPSPKIGETVSWGSSWFKPWAEWQGVRWKRLGTSFDPGDLRLYTG